MAGERTFVTPESPNECTVSFWFIIAFTSNRTGRKTRMNSAIANFCCGSKTWIQLQWTCRTRENITIDKRTFYLHGAFRERIHGWHVFTSNSGGKIECKHKLLLIGSTTKTPLTTTSVRNVCTCLQTNMAVSGGHGRT